MKPRLVETMIVVLIAASGIFAGEVNRGDLEKALAKGADFLVAQQNEDGGFGDFAGKRVSSVGYTGMVLSALAGIDADSLRKHSAVIEKAVAFMLKNAHPDGGLYMTQEYYKESGRKETFESYETSLAVSALAALDAEKYKDVVQKGAAYLVGIQDDGAKDPLSKGGIGYGSNKSMSNLSTTFYALQALKVAGVSEDAPVWKDVVAFVSSCQNLAETNKLEWAAKSNDGGFIYSPIESKFGTTKAGEQPKTAEQKKGERPSGEGAPKAPEKAGEKKDGSGMRGPMRDPKLSYASMTCAGISCLLIAKVDKSDVRIQSALNWLSKHFTLEENPGMGQQGLFYYYSAFAAAMCALGEKNIKDKEGKDFNWAQTLGGKLLALQGADGAWINTADRWEEKNKVLCTSHAMRAIKKVLAGMN